MVSHVNINKLIKPQCAYIWTWVLKGCSFIIFNIICICVCGCLYVTCMQMPTKTKKRVLDPLELKSQVVVSHLLWVLGPELKSFGRAASDFKCWAISPAPMNLNLPIYSFGRIWGTKNCQFVSPFSLVVLKEKKKVKTKFKKISTWVYCPGLGN